MADIIEGGSWVPLVKSEDERICQFEFEKWCGRTKLPLPLTKDGFDLYTNDNVFSMWVAWQESWKVSKEQGV